MPRTASRATSIAETVGAIVQTGMRLLGLVALSLGLAACSSTQQKKPEQPALTGDVLTDGPNAVAFGPKKDRVLWQYRTATAAMRHGDFELAKHNLDDALTTLRGIFSPDKEAKKARGYFHAESKKTFIGEPYERSMAFIYRGILYWMDGEPDNARACFRSAELEDSDTQEHQYAGDWVLPDYLDGLASEKLGGDGSDAFKRAQTSAKTIKLPPYNKKANLLVFVEFGPGPTKLATGEYAEQLRFHVEPSPVLSAEIKVDALDFPVAPTDDVWFQASTRGGRAMDHILGNKAVFKSATDTAGNVALIGGLGTAVMSHDRTAQEVGLGVAMAGLVSKMVSLATTPEADTRTWDNLPRYLSFASVPVPPGTHTLTIDFKDAAGQAVARLRKNLTIEVPGDGQDKVVFISDQSSTPQKL